MSKRGRACTSCAGIKIKCQLGSDTSLQPPCERCVRLKKECVLSAPKRQRDRVLELESQVANLTRILEEHGIENPETAASASLRDGSSMVRPSQDTTIAASTALKKRRREGSVAEATSAEFSPRATMSAVLAPFSSAASNADTFKLDQIIAPEQQQRVLDRYVNDLTPTFPIVPLTGEYSLDALRVDRPILLQAIMYAAGTGFLSLDVQEDIARLLLNRLATSAMSQSDKSLELVQAIQLCCVWYRAPKHHRHVAVYQLIQLASALVMDLGSSGALDSSAIQFLSQDFDLLSTDCWRAWLACYSMSAAMSIFLRRDNSTPWTEHHEQCLLCLPSLPVDLPSDRWLSVFFRAERLCEQIAMNLGFNELYTYHDVSEPDMKNKIQTCRNLILNWRVSILQPLRSPVILFWEHLATAYMHEVVLHTQTNKQSFAAPYVSERLSLTDFPAPVVTQDHITAVYELVSAVHAVIDIYANFDAQTMIALSGLFVASRAAYANYLLAKLHIAVTIPGNTLSGIIDSTIVRAEEYNNKLVDASERVNAVDSWCGSARILGSSNRMREWYHSYATNLYSEDGLLNPTAGLQFDPYVPAHGVPPVSGPISPTQKSSDWETFFRFSDSAADFGLDILFAEPMPGPAEAMGGAPFDPLNQK